VASSIVSLIGTQISVGSPNIALSLERIAELLDDRPRLRTLEESEEGLRGLAACSGLQKHGVLTDRRMKFQRNFPPRPLRLPMKLRQRDEAQLRISRVDELERLRDAVALDDLRLQRIVHAKRFHRLDGRRPIGGRNRI